MLESQSYTERFETAVKLFNKELMTIRIQQELKKKVESNTKETERKYVLKEQMKVIQQQLGGDKDPKQAYIEKVNKKVEEMKKTKVSEAAVTVSESTRLKIMAAGTPMAKPTAAVMHRNMSISAAKRRHTPAAVMPMQRQMPIS